MLSTGCFSTSTVSCPSSSSTVTLRVARRFGTLVLVASQCSVPPTPPLLTPTKFADGAPALCSVCSATATPGMPEKPSPASSAPSELGVAPSAGFASTSARPLPPVPPPNLLLNVTDMCALFRGCSKNEEPALKGSAPVSKVRLPEIVAAPFVLQVEADVFGTVPVPLN